jgi:hypothetical protein
VGLPDSSDETLTYDPLMGSRKERALPTLHSTGGSEFLSSTTVCGGRYLDVRGRNRGGHSALEPVLFTILDTGFREDHF